MEGLVAVDASVLLDLAHKEDAVVMEELLVLEMVAQEPAVTGLEVGLVNQEVVDMVAEAADTAVGLVDIQGA